MKSKARTVVFFVTFLVASAVFQPAVTSAVSLLGEWMCSEETSITTLPCWSLHLNPRSG